MLEVSIGEFFQDWFFVVKVLISYFLLIWVYTLFSKNVGIIDVGWALSFFVANLGLYYQKADWDPSQIFLFSALAFWCLRLTIYLLSRYLKFPEDPRYTVIKNKLGKNPHFKMVVMFLFQGSVASFVSFPFLFHLYTKPENRGALYIGGAILILVSSLLEGIADFQLARFKKDPKNKGVIFNKGLWKYSRHPNYFFEWLVWVGISICALSARGGYFSIISVIVMYLFLTRITGVKHNEKFMKKKERKGHSDYLEKTSAFFPRSPKN